MPAFFPAATVVALVGMVHLVASQASSTVSQSMPPSATSGFDIAQIEEDERFRWCLSQENNCISICGGAFSTNNCEEEDLSYDCTCDNGTVPDVSAFRETIPFFICEATFEQCIETNANDAKGQSTCEENRQCGTRNATMLEEDSEDSEDSSSQSSSSDSESDSSSSATSEETASSTAEDAAIVVSQQMATWGFAAVFAVAFQFLV